MDHKTVSDKAGKTRRGREKYYLAALAVMACLCVCFAYRAFGSGGSRQNAEQIEVDADIKEITHEEKNIYTEEYQEEA